MKAILFILLIVAHLECSKPIEYVRISGSISSKKDEKKDFDFDEYARRISSHESSDNPTAISPSGLYMGKYQIGELALKDIGWKGVTVQKFRRDPSIFDEHDQRKALEMIAAKNRVYLSKYIISCSGKEMYGIKITTAGMLAAAHHIGARKVKDFLRTGKVAKDGNGIKMTLFLRRMNDL